MTQNAITPLVAQALTASLTVNDLQKSLTWYCDVVGFTIDRKIERDGKLQAVALNAGSIRILLGQDDGAKGWNREKGTGMSMQLVTEQSIDDIANGIKSRGGVLLNEPADMPWGARMFRVVDPDGFKWTIASPRKG